MDLRVSDRLSSTKRCMMYLGAGVGGEATVAIELCSSCIPKDGCSNPGVCAGLAFDGGVSTEAARSIFVPPGFRH